jgi:hypothetical protein
MRNDGQEGSMQTAINFSDKFSEFSEQMLGFR